MITMSLLLGGHRGEKKTLNLIKKALLLANNEKRYKKPFFSLCARCQESKASNHRKLGELRPFPPPERKWEEISMDFIFKLPKTRDNRKSILVVVDKLSKRAHFIALPGEHKAEDTAKIFYEEVYKHHGLPRKNHFR